MRKILLYIIIFYFLQLANLQIFAKEIESSLDSKKSPAISTFKQENKNLDSKDSINTNLALDITTNTQNHPVILSEAKSLDSINITESNTIPPKKLEKLQFIYGFDFGFFTDNLEDSFAYTPTRTLFAASIFPEIGASFYNQHIRAGTFLIYNMGEKLTGYNTLRLGLSLFYDISHKNFSGYFGIFSRKYWLIKYPHFFYRDDFLFFNPMINGILLQYNSKKYNLKTEFMLDWYGGNLAKRIDEFMIQIALEKGLLSYKNTESNLLFLGIQSQLFHTKNSNILNPNSNNLDVFLLDRFYYNVYFGADFTPLMPYMNEMSAKISLLGGIDRKRFESKGAEPFSHAFGGELSLSANFKGFGIANSLYFGQPQYKYFGEYGENIYWGLPFYQARFYDRAELFYEYKNAYLRARISFIAHITDIFSHQQMLSIIIDTQKLIESFK